MSYNRTLSPGGRRIHHPGRASDSFAPGSYYSGGASGHRTAYGVSPRTSNTGVIPLSSETFVNVPPPSGTYNSRPSERHDTYSGRPRRSSLVDQQRGSAPSVTQMPNRSRPTVVQNDNGRPSSPMKGSRDKDYYVTPASSKEPSRQVEHKKLYSVDDGKAKLVADVDLPAEKEKERHHRRRESTDRSGYKSSSLTADGDRHRDRSRRTYYPNSGHNGRGRDGKSIEDDDAFSYTDPAGMYRDTEPRWREQRPRRGSVDRGGASRERPVSMLDVNTYGADPRLSAKNISNGPPVSTRGWDKIGDGVGRTQSVRDAPPRVAQSPNRGRFLDPRDPYYVPPRTASRDGRPEGRPRANSRDNRSLAIHHNGPAPVDRYADSYASESDFLREPRRERRPSHSRRNDASVERRGFGIRADSKDRHGHNKGSNESFEKPRREYRDSGYAEPHRRETAPPEMASAYQQYERERRREDDMAYGRDYSERPRDREQRERDRDWVETDRERERERMMERSNRDTRDRDRGDSDREKHHSRRSSGLGAATGGLAGAAAAFGLGKVFGREKSDERDSDKERDSDRERERERQRREDRDREREKEREREKQAEREREKEKDREREKEREREAERQRYEDNPRREERDRRPRGPDSYSDEAYGSQRDRDRDAHREGDRSLNFAFEKPAEPSRPPQPERPRERDFEAMDPDEDYRRRMEQVQKELGRGPPPADERSEVSDPDRERRRREREARLREREELREPKLDAGIGPTTYGEQSAPPPGMRRDYENESVNSGPSAAGSADTQGLRRKPSVLDRPMDYDEPAAQIIDNRLSDKRENRVRIVDPPTEEEDRKPKGILKKPTEKFPDYPDAVREGVAPLKDASKDGIPPGARWTKIDRRLVNPEALEEAKERFEERMDCVIVLRVLTKEEIQKLADKTREIRDKRYDEEERSDRKTQRRRERNKDRKDRDEFSDDSEDEFKEKPVRMLEAPSTGGASSEADFIRENRDRRRERDERSEAQYNMSGGLGRREDEQGRY